MSIYKQSLEKSKQIIKENFTIFLTMSLIASLPQIIIWFLIDIFEDMNVSSISALISMPLILSVCCAMNKKAFLEQDISIKDSFYGFKVPANIKYNSLSAKVIIGPILQFLGIIVLFFIAISISAPFYSELSPNLITYSQLFFVFMIFVWYTLKVYQYFLASVLCVMFEDLNNKGDYKAYSSIIKKNRKKVIWFFVVGIVPIILACSVIGFLWCFTAFYNMLIFIYPVGLMFFLSRTVCFAKNLANTTFDTQNFDEKQKEIDEHAKRYEGVHPDLL